MYHAWTDLTFKRIKAYTKRAQKLRRYHMTHGPKMQSTQSKSPEVLKKENNKLEDAEIFEEDRNINTSILEAVRAGLGKMEIALQLFALDNDLYASSDSEGAVGLLH